MFGYMGGVLVISSGAFQVGSKLAKAETKYELVLSAQVAITFPCRSTARGFWA